MKKTPKKIAICLVLCLAAVFSFTSFGGIITHQYTQEYVVGQGNIKGEVNAADFYARDERFEIGATEDGYAVFKNPYRAFDALKEKYSDGLKLIRKEFWLLPVSRVFYSSYKTYGWQVSSGSSEAQEQARFISRFFDIYENSFD